MISVELPYGRAVEEQPAAGAVESCRHKEPVEDGVKATKNRSAFVQSFCLGRPSGAGKRGKL